MIGARLTLPPLGGDAAKALQKRARAAENRLARYTTVWRDIVELAMPQRDTLTGKAEGQERTTAIFDSTACYGTSRFANRVVQAMFPAQERWAELRLSVPELDDADDPERADLQLRLDAVNRLIFQAVMESNFDLAIVEAAHDLAAGTMALLLEPGRTAGGWAAPALRFQAVPVGAVAVEDGPFGTVGAAFHRQRLAGRIIKPTWPDATLPDQLERAIARNPDQEVELLHATAYDYEARAWRIAVLHKDAVLVDRTARACPWIIVRWMRTPGEIYGYGPLTMALADIRTLNKAKEQTLQNGALAIAGVHTAVDDGVLNPYTIKLVPGAVIPVASNGGPRGPSLAPLPRPGNFDLSQIIIEDLRRDIRAALFDIPLPDQIRSNVSATEIEQRMAEYNRQTGAFGRLYIDGTRPLMFRIVDILDDAGILPGVFELMQDDAVRAVPTSPLAVMMDMAEVQTIARYIQMGAAFEAYEPGFIRKGLATDRVAAWLAERLSVPAALRVTRAEREAQARQAQEAQMLEMAAKSPAVARVADNLTAPQTIAG
ncbi:MAG: portal protein, partial [Burkholderiaceae bacterium]|nr:portal protein [Burkholderiaceae bacterium]